MKTFEASTHVKVSGILLTVSRALAWVCAFFALLALMGDPAHPPTPSEAAQSNHLMYLRFSWASGSWLFVALIAWWHRHKQARWASEGWELYI